MEAHLCLPTRHFLAMQHHKTVLVHSSIRLPALQAKVGAPPGAARVPVVGAGVVLSCALGAMYWKRARALQLPMHYSNQPSHGGNGAGDDPESGIVSIEELLDLLSKICIRELHPKPPQLTKLIHECLAQKDVKIFSKNQDLTSLLEENFPKTNIGDHDYNLGFVLILALISEKKYVKAKEICNQLIIPMPSDSEARPDPLITIRKDARPDLLLAIINMMMAMESMLQPDNKISTLDWKQQPEQVETAWENGSAGDHPASGIVPIEQVETARENGGAGDHSASGIVPIEQVETAQENGGAGDHPASGDASIEKLLSEICIRKIDSKPSLLTDRIRQCLAQKDLNPDLMTSLLEANFPQIGDHEYNLGIVLIVALISEKKYAKAQEICNKLISYIPSDARPHLLSAIISMMMAMESMLMAMKNLEEVEKSWEDYKSKHGFQAARPF